MRASKVIGIVILVLIAAGIGGYAYIMSLRPEGLEFAVIDISAIPDGIYPGEARFTPVKVKLSVTVSGGSIASIDINEHVNGKGQAAEAIVGMVVSSQSLQVDTISGATWSSYTILKAIEDALLQEQGNR